LGQTIHLEFIVLFKDESDATTQWRGKPYHPIFLDIQSR
jgi:hypothetical protein